MSESQTDIVAGTHRVLSVSFVAQTFQFVHNTRKLERLRYKEADNTYLNQDYQVCTQHTQTK